MVAHDDVTQVRPIVANDRLLDAVDQPASIRVIADNLLPGVAPRLHVINAARKRIQSRRGVTRGSTLDKLIVQQKTNNKA
jgi:hypothetical protein